MSLVKYSLKAQFSSTSAGSKDLGDLSGEGSTSDLNVGNTRSFSVPSTAVDAVVDLCGLTEARLIYIQTNRELLFKLNGTEELTVKPLPNTVGGVGHLLVTTDGVTSMTVTNSSGEIANVLMMAAGE